MMSRSCVVLVASLALAATASGCSYLTMSYPTMDPAGNKPPDCDEDGDGPWVDGIAASAWVISSLVGLGFVSECDPDNDSEDYDQQCGQLVAGTVASVGFVVLHVMSASNGSRKNRRCMEAKREYETTVGGDVAGGRTPPLPPSDR
jgi:hypothetical protein